MIKENSVEAKFKRNNKILFNQESECLVELIQAIDKSNRKVVVKWALEMAEGCLLKFNKQYPQEKRPAFAIEQSKYWAYGTIKMKEAKPAILACHALAQEIDDKKNQALIHAIGQGASSVHVKSHANGLVFYELTSIVLEAGINEYKTLVDQRIKEYMDRLIYWNNSINQVTHPWASFLNK
jgi:hypothetical protein